MSFILDEKHKMIENDSFVLDVGIEEIRKWCNDNGVNPEEFLGTSFGVALQAFNCLEYATFNVIKTDSDGYYDKVQQITFEVSVEKRIKEIIEGLKIHDVVENESDVLYVYQGENYQQDIKHCSRDKKDASENLFGISQAYIIGIEEDKIIIKTEWDSVRSSSYIINRFVKMYDRILLELTRKETIGDIELVSEEDKKDILTLHDTEFTVTEKPAYRLLQDSAEENPDKVALVAVDRTLTYKELNEEANAVGHALIAEIRMVQTGLGAVSGLDPDTIVAVMADRDSYAYVMRDGVLKAGGAFLPIDPEYPEERIRFILED
ncbi:MAG: AMP-binding protein, partial [Butyrivibrio sp.]|nr:AMP-binding protein [Butyrivibrio sp.]